MIDPIIPGPAPEGQPANVERDSLATLISKCKAKSDSIDYKEKMSIPEKVQLGDMLIELDSRCVHGQWEKALETIKISKQRASDYIRAAKRPRADVLKCEYWNEVMQLVADQEKADAEAAARKQKPASKAVIRCERCDTEGPVKGCLSCMVLNRPADWEFCSRECRIGPPKKCEACIKLNKEKREPGQDAKPPKPPKGGQVKFDWKPVDKFTGGFIRSVDEFGKAYGVKETATLQDLRQRASDLRDDFKAEYERVTKQKAPNDEAAE